MADLSKIKLNGTTYNFKDAWARTNLQTSSQVQSAITTALGNITGFEISIVQTLPAAGNQGTFYFVPNSQGSGNNIYDEYVYVNNSWEKIGTTEIDLSDYLQKTDIAAWAKAANKPSYTANEVGALPNTTSIPNKTSDLTNDSGYITSSNIPQEVFWATYGTTTNTEITTALVAGKVPVVAVNGRLLTFKRELGVNMHRFSCVDNGTEYSATCTSNTWGTDSQTFIPIDSNGKISIAYLPVYDGGITP